MLRCLTCLLTTVGFLLVIAPPARTQPNKPPSLIATAQTEEAEQICSQAITPLDCRTALPACGVTLAELERRPRSLYVEQVLVVVLNHTAGCEELSGQYGQAEAHYRRSLQILRRLHGPEDPFVAKLLNDLAKVLHSQGKFADSEAMYRQALAMRQRLLGPENFHVASSVNDLALVLHSQGKYAESEVLLRQALAMRRKLLFPEHPSIGASLNNLALVLQSQGKYAMADVLFRQALDICKATTGPEHSLLASNLLVSVLNNLALALQHQGKYVEAEALHRQTLTKRQKLFGPEHPDVAQSLHNLGTVLDRQAKYAEAEDFHRQTLAMQKKVLGPEHPDVAQSLHNLAVTLVSKGDFSGAVSALQEAARIREKQIRDTLNENRLQSLLGMLRDEEDFVYGLLLQRPNDSILRTLALTTALFRRGRAAESGATANRLLHRNLASASVAARYHRWQSVRQSRETLLYSGPGAVALTLYKARLKELQLQAESLEHELTVDLPDLRALQPPSFEDIIPLVAHSVPRDGVLVEIVWMRSLGERVGGSEWQWGRPHYVAFLLFPDQRVTMQDLGEAAQDESRVRALRAALTTPSSDPIVAARALYEQIFLPLLPKLLGRSQIIVSPDGILNLIPFDTLHDGNDYLLGRYRFRYLTSGRDLLREPSQRPAQPALIIGNPDYGKSAAGVSANGPQSLYQRLSDLPRLPGTEMEARALQPLLNVIPLLSEQATEQAIRASHAPWVLHIATHGLFLEDMQFSTTVLGPESSGGSLFTERRLQNLSQPALVAAPLALPQAATGWLSRSFLVLAGAARGQQAQSSAQDGLLTADEARSLDLDGTQLVVLSACDTALGGLSAGQGVYGLRHAFLVAGAETLVTSLWRLDDHATGVLMTLYYRKLLDSRTPADRLEAMHSAMQEMRRHGDRTHPYYWAPFLVIGQSGPLRPPAGWWNDHHQD